MKREKRTKKMLLVGSAIATTSFLAVNCGPTIYANPKGCFYDGGLDADPCYQPPDAGPDVIGFGDSAPPQDAAKDADANIADADDGG